MPDAFGCLLLCQHNRPESKNMLVGVFFFKITIHQIYVNFWKIQTPDWLLVSENM